METGDADGEGRGVVRGPLAGLLSDELLEAVGVGADVGRPGVGLLEGGAIGVGLGVIRVHAGGGGEEEALDVVLDRGGEQVEVDAEGVLEDERVVGLDEAHAAHVSREVVDLLAALGDAVGQLLVAEIELVELVAVGVLLEVDVGGPVGAHDVEALGHEANGEVRADEAAATSDEHTGARDDLVVFRDVRHAWESREVLARRSHAHTEEFRKSETALQAWGPGCRRKLCF